MNPPFHDLFRQFHIGNAVHEQPAGAVGLFNHRDRMPHLVQQVGGSQSGRAAAYHSHALARAKGRNPGLNPALFKARFDQVQFIVPVGHAVVGQITGLFAQRRTHPPGKLREGGRLQKPFQRRPFLALIQKVVPFGNQVVQRTPEIGLAEGHAAVHAPRRLAAADVFGLGRVQVVKILKPRLRVPVGVFRPFIFHETSRLAHTVTLLSNRPGIRRKSRP